MVMTGRLQLVVVRHGEAERSSGDDTVRALTTRGREEVVATARALAESLPGGGRVLCSPLLRARQTADLLAAELGLPAPETVPGITPDDDPVRALRNLDKLLVAGRPLIVASHMPLVGALAALLEHGDMRLAPGVPTGAAIVLEGDHISAGLMKTVARIGNW
jgi:phosphohistidine phosphatase